MNGKLVVSGLAGLVVAVLAAAFMWPEGQDNDDASKAAATAPADPTEKPEADKPMDNFRVADRGSDGSITITNVPEGMEDPVVAAKQRAAERAAERGERENPFEGFVDDGSPLTDEAMKQPVMADMDPSNDAYDAETEARQRFNAYESDLLASVPLDPEDWKAITRNHQDDIKGLFKRSKELVDAGHNEDARVLIEEWNELQNKYKAQAYGRSPQPFEPAQ